MLELTYTAWDLEPFALDCGWTGPPFVWDEARRFQLRCELDAAYFHLYGLDRADAGYILDTFPIVRRKDEAIHSTYRTRDTILEIYDALAECARENRSFTNIALAFPPADPRVAHAPRLPATSRPTFRSSVYFEHVLPLVARLQPGGVEVGRLLRTLEVLAESESRRAALHDRDDGPWKPWAASFQYQRGLTFADAAAAFLDLLGDGTLTRWRDRIRPAPNTDFVDDPWLNLDAFCALRLALDAPAETVERHRTEAEQRYPALAILRAAAA